MARTLKAKIKVEADTKQANTAIKKTGKAMKDATKASGTLGGALSELKTKYLAIAAATAVAVKGFLEMISLANAQEDSIKKFDVAIGNLGGGQAALAAGLFEQATQLERITTLTKAEIQAVQQRIALFIKEEDQIKTLTLASIDFAEAKSKNATEIADALVRSIVTENNALLEQGIVVTGVVGTLERYDSILISLSSTQGTAAAVADTTSGKLNKLFKSFKNVVIVLGTTITQLEAFADAVIGATSAMRKIERKFKDIIFVAKNFIILFESILEEIFPKWIARGLAVAGSMDKVRAKLQEQADALQETREENIKLAEVENRRLRGLEAGRLELELEAASERRYQESLRGTIEQVDTVSTGLESYLSGLRLARGELDLFTAAQLRNTESFVANNAQRRLALDFDPDRRQIGDPFVTIGGGMFSIAPGVTIGANGRVTSFIGGRSSGALASIGFP